MGTKDMTEKILVDYNDVFADIINGIVFNGQPVVQEDDLENEKDKSIYKFENQIHEQERDTAKFWKNQKIRLALFGLEHQTKTDPDMPLRVIGYDGAAYRGQLFKHQQGERYPVATIVLYFGTTHWNQPTTLFQCMNISNELKPFINDYKINLVEVSFLEDKLHLFHSDFRIVAEYFINKRKNPNYVPDDQKIRHVDEFLKLLQALEDDDCYEELIQQAHDRQKKEGGVTMSTVMELRENKGRLAGIQEGRLAGIQEGRLAGIREGRLAGIQEGERKGRQEGVFEGKILAFWEMKLTIEEIAGKVSMSVDQVRQVLDENGVR